jgi:hypothetical protein|tara:strand:- start:9963 stop:10136 length:174 start_codon:yes stop_codon:yes gene_type:complete
MPIQVQVMILVLERWYCPLFFSVESNAQAAEIEERRMAKYLFLAFGYISAVKLRITW